MTDPGTQARWTPQKKTNEKFHISIQNCNPKYTFLAVFSTRSIKFFLMSIEFQYVLYKQKKLFLPYLAQYNFYERNSIELSFGFKAGSKVNPLRPLL